MPSGSTQPAYRQRMLRSVGELEQPGALENYKVPMDEHRNRAEAGRYENHERTQANLPTGSSEDKAGASSRT
jgi:hypothetical protein